MCLLLTVSLNSPRRSGRAQWALWPAQDVSWSVSWSILQRKLQDVPAKAVLGTTLSQGVADTSSSSGGAATWSGQFSSQAQADHHARHQALQDDLTEELATQAAALKNYSYKLQEAVQTRGQLVDGTERVLEKNTDTAKKISARASEQYKRGTSSLCLTCMVFLVVGVVFSMMVVYIKMTHLGYRGKPGGWSLFRSRDPFDDEL